MTYNMQWLVEDFNDIIISKVGSDPVSYHDMQGQFSEYFGNSVTKETIETVIGNEKTIDVIRNELSEQFEFDIDSQIVLLWLKTFIARL